MSKNKKPKSDDKPMPAKPPADDPLHRGRTDEPTGADEARNAALARVKALEEMERMERRSETQ